MHVEPGDFFQDGWLTDEHVNVIEFIDEVRHPL
jgi:hypothetical protein